MLASNKSLFGFGRVSVNQVAEPEKPDFSKLWMPEARKFWNDPKSLKKHLDGLLLEQENISESGMPVEDWQEDLDYAVSQIINRLSAIEIPEKAPRQLSKAPVQKQAHIRRASPRKAAGRRLSTAAVLTRATLLFFASAVVLLTVFKLWPILFFALFVKLVLLRGK